MISTAHMNDPHTNINHGMLGNGSLGFALRIDNADTLWRAWKRLVSLVHEVISCPFPL